MMFNLILKKLDGKFLTIFIYYIICIILTLYKKEHNEYFHK